jgi:iron complex transport system substrate-binding protein
MRIASLLPVATEIVDALGLTENLVAVTHACTYPELVRLKPRITRSRLPEAVPLIDAGPALGWQVANQPLVTIDYDALHAAKPNIILTQPIDDSSTIPYGEVIEAIASLPKPRPKIIDVHSTSLEEILLSIRAIGVATGRVTEADYVCDTLWNRLLHVRKTVAIQARTSPRTIVIEWINPLYCGGRWQHELIRIAGGHDYVEDMPEPVSISWHQIREFKPEVIVVAPCNCSMEQARKDMPALEALPGYWSLPAVRQGRVYLADGREYFNGYGPRIIKTLELLAFVIHPELFADVAPSPSKAICWF